MPAPPSLPTTFPCWVRAVYSWGGETKRDLGFLEGDLIECLNAGDGSWWTGRLRRDPRMVGSFPSNFVQVLGESFRPPSRCPSPLPPKEPAPNLAAQKAKSVRKPFQSYRLAASPNPEASARDAKGQNGSTHSPSGSMRRPFSSMSRKHDAGPSHLSQQRPVSQLNSPAAHRSMGASPIPSSLSRPVSPSIHPYTSRAPSPQPFATESSPPPPPPPHRYATSRAPSPQPAHSNSFDQGHPDHIDQAASPRPKQPSPFTSAINDIMDYVDMTLGANGEDADPEHPAIWGPDDYEKIYGSQAVRPHTSMATETQADSGYSTGDFDVDSESHRSGLPQLDDYVPRMERRLKQLKDQGWTQRQSQEEDEDLRPPIPDKDSYNLRERIQRPLSSLSIRASRRLKKQKSAVELGQGFLGRTFTTKTAVTTSTNSSSTTNQSLMSGASAGGFSATSAGSYHRRKLETGKGLRPMSSMSFIENGSRTSFAAGRPQTPLTGVSYHSSHASFGQEADAPNANVLGGLCTPTPKKSSLFKKLVDSARTTAATARSAIASAGHSSRPGSPVKSGRVSAMTGIAGGTASRPASAAAKDTAGPDWVQVRRDVHRSNSPSPNERQERADRCQTLDIPVISPVEELLAGLEGDEGADGRPVAEPADFSACNLANVDKSARFVSDSLPAAATTPAGLVQGYLCRPYRSDVQRLRAIFTWVAERVAWEEDFEGDVDVRRVLQTRRGCSQEIASLVADMCTAAGIHAEVVRGYLKAPGEGLDLDLLERPNHWWNAVVVDGEWRVVDCALGSPTNPRRALYSTTNAHAAEPWWFLTRPSQACYTHVPCLPQQQHLVPPAPAEILLSLPCACPPYFAHGLAAVDFDTSALHLEQLELAHVQLRVPDDVECVAEVEVRALARDADGDLFESGDVARAPALAQPDWVAGEKRFTVKALLPGDEGRGVLKIYAGKRGLMHSIKSNPHPLALALPLFHSGANPPYAFLTRHPTPHAQRHDLYVAQPQCARLAANNTFVFCVRQHPASLRGSPHAASSAAGAPFGGGPNPLARPTSAMSFVSVSASGSASGGSVASSSTAASAASAAAAAAAAAKPAKLAIQTPSGKIIRLTRKADPFAAAAAAAALAGGGDAGASEWETIIKVGERGTWRGLVLADRSARWCVFAEWECI